MDLTTSYLSAIPQRIRDRFDFYEVRNAAAIMAATNPQRFADLLAVLDDFVLKTTDLTVPGGQESALAARLNRAFRARGWREARVDTIIELSLEIARYGDDPAPTTTRSRVVNEGYKVDNFVDRIAGDVEWNAKDGNLDRDLGAYRYLYDAALIDVALMVTRTQADLRALGQRLGRQAGLAPEAARRILGTTTTTNIDKLLPRLTRGDAGGCPVLVAAISARTWEEAAPALG